MTPAKIRVAVAVGSDGDWAAVGYKGADESGMVSDLAECIHTHPAIYWLETELPAPSVIEPRASKA